MALLKPSIVPINTQRAYTFNDTGINVFSFEEVLYHCYHYWKQSMLDFTEKHLSKWVEEELGLFFICAKMNKIIDSNLSFAEKYIQFISIENYFNEIELSNLKNEINEWEGEQLWEQLKVKGDMLLKSGKYDKAIKQYLQSVEYKKHSSTYNNLAIANIKKGMLKNAETALETAAIYSNDIDFISIKINISKLLIMQNKYESAEEILNSLLVKYKDDANISKEYKATIFSSMGEVKKKSGEYNNAANYFRKAHALNNIDLYLTQICKIHIKDKNYKSAIAVLSEVKDKKSKEVLFLSSQIDFLTGNALEAIKKMGTLIVLEKNNHIYWAYLAMLYRETDNIEKAYGAVLKSLDISSNNNNALFELALIKKKQNKNNEYEEMLNKILKQLKEEYYNSY